MELRHLRYFVAVAEELHVGRAAVRLHLAQPPLSRQIQQLEREIGVPLFIRSHRRVQLTAARQAFLAGARRTLAEADRAVHDAQRAQRGEIGRLSLGFVGTATAEALPLLLQAFRRQYPHVELALQSMTTQEQVAALQNKRIQIGLLRPPLDDPQITLRALLYESLVAVLPERHPLASLERIALRTLANEPFILYPRSDSPRVRDTIVGVCQAAGFSPTITQEAREMETIAGLVAGGIGVALVIGSVANLRHTGVVYKDIEDYLPPWELALAWWRDEDSPVARAFINVAEEVYTYQDLVPQR